MKKEAGPVLMVVAAIAILLIVGGIWLANRDDAPDVAEAGDAVDVAQPDTEALDKAFESNTLPEETE